MSWTKSMTFLKRIWPRKLSLKLTLIYAGLFSGVLIALNAGILFGVRYFLIQQIRGQVRASSENTLHAISENGWGLNDTELMAESYSQPGIGIRLADTSGRTIRVSSGLPAGLPAPSKQTGTVQVMEIRNRHLVIENSRVEINGRFYGYLQMAYDMRTEYRFMKLLSVVMAVVDAVGILLSMWIGSFISRRALRPIDAVTTAAKTISGSDLSGRVEVGRGNDELARLALTFNEMIERLQDAFDRQKRFVSDASHELRTPIAIIRGYADMIGRWGKDDPEVLRESVAAIGKETDGMESLVERLLFLACSDNGGPQMSMETFDLYTILTELAEENQLAFHRTIHIKIQENLRLTADRALIKQMLRALTDNAVKYTPADGTITVEAGKEAGGIVLIVRDTGVGIPAEDLPHVFDRFYRVDKARSREYGGTGLGLSIVRRIVDAHHGIIRIESAPGKGTAIRIVLPKEAST